MKCRFINARDCCTFLKPKPTLKASMLTVVLGLLIAYNMVRFAVIQRYHCCTATQGWKKHVERDTAVTAHAMKKESMQSDLLNVSEFH